MTELSVIKAIPAHSEGHAAQFFRQAWTNTLTVRQHTLETFSLGLPVARGKLSAETRIGDPFSRSICRVTAVSIDFARASSPSAGCCPSAYRVNALNGASLCSAAFAISTSYCIDHTSYELMAVPMHAAPKVAHTNSTPG